RDLDVDFLAFSSHKVFGPTGMGILYGKEKWLDKMPPYQGGGEMIETVTFEKTTYNKLPFKFEAGTPHIAGVIGLDAALKYVQSIGLENIRIYEKDLMAYAMDQLTSIDSLRFVGQAAERSGAISFLLEGIHPYDTAEILDNLGIAVRTGQHCAEPIMRQFGIPGTVRASFSFYNNRDDVNRLKEGILRARKMLGYYGREINRSEATGNHRGIFILRRLDGQIRIADPIGERIAIDRGSIQGGG